MVVNDAEQVAWRRIQAGATTASREDREGEVEEAVAAVVGFVRERQAGEEAERRAVALGGRDGKLAGEILE